MPEAVDPFQLEIMRNAFDAIADDMALTLMRTSHSGIVRDSLDFSTAICDPEGQTLAQGVCTPMQLGSFYDAMRKLITQYAGRIFPGDVFIANDPYAAAGQHLPDRLHRDADLSPRSDRGLGHDGRAPFGCRRHRRRQQRPRRRGDLPGGASAAVRQVHRAGRRQPGALGRHRAQRAYPRQGHRRPAGAARRLPQRRARDG
jgi:hypothetical protein